MSDRVVLHIGAMKTGTTYLQNLLQAHPGPLAEHGVEFTGGLFPVQSRAVRQALAVAHSGEGRARQWNKLVRTARRAEAPTSVISMEFLSFADDEQLALLLRPLRRTRVDVVLTVRDQLTVLPAQWQTYCRNNGRWGWPAYLWQVRDRRWNPRPTSAHRTFHRAQDLDEILPRWAAAPQVDSLTVVVNPGRAAPPDELWRRFTEAAALDLPALPLDDGDANTSLGYGSCDLLRRMNPHLNDLPPMRYRRLTRRLILRALAPLRDQESRPALNRSAAAFARDRNLQVRETVERLGLPVVGDLDELPTTVDLGGYARRTPAVPRAETLTAARTAWRHLARRGGRDEAEMPGSLRRLVEESATMLRQSRRRPSR